MADADHDGLVLHGVSLTYPGPPEVEALRATHLRVDPGTFLAITGPSGSGKSTLLNVLGLLDRPTTGTYRIAGTDIADLGPAELAWLRARTFGFVFQRFHLLAAHTALENVELGLTYAGVPRRHRRSLATDALVRVGLEARLHHRPFALSGGECQRVAIARAIVCDRAFLLADEPTGSLDSATSAAVLDLLEDLAADGRTVICVTHSDQAARRANARIDMLDGTIAQATDAA